MTRRLRVATQAAFATALIAIAFGCGWLAYGRHHAETRRLRVAVAESFVRPRGFDFVLLNPNPSPARFSAGDRVDVLIVVDGEPQPLIHDVLLTRNANTYAVLLVRPEHREIIDYLQQLGHEIAFRPTIVPAEPGYAADFLKALEQVKRPQAEG